MSSNASPTEDRLLQDASTEVYRHRWAPAADGPRRPRGVYLLHGTGEHAARYERLARRLTAAGWHVGAHDHPGHGRSGGPRGRVPVPGSLATRAAIEVARFARETDATPFLFGHSLGGVVAAELVVLHHLPVAGLLLSAPAIVPRLSRRDTIKLKLLSMVAPTHIANIAYDPSYLTHDPEQQRIAHADPLIHGFKSAEFIGWLMNAAERVQHAGQHLAVPTLVMIAGDDVVIDTERTRQFVEAAPNDLVTTKVYPGCQHELLNAPPQERAQVEQDILDWLDKQAST